MRDVGSNARGIPKLAKIYYFYTMTTLQVDILNPKAGKLLEDLAELNLISIRNSSDDGFLKLVNKLSVKYLLF